MWFEGNKLPLVPEGGSDIIIDNFGYIFDT